MPTEMTDRDSSIVLEVLKPAQSNRGRPRHDERTFREAIHYFAVHSMTWRALPSEHGKWNGVWTRFRRLSRDVSVPGARRRLLDKKKPQDRSRRQCTAHRDLAACTGRKPTPPFLFTRPASYILGTIYLRVSHRKTGVGTRPNPQSHGPGNTTRVPGALRSSRELVVVELDVINRRGSIFLSPDGNIYHGQAEIARFYSNFLGHVKPAIVRLNFVGKGGTCCRSPENRKWKQHDD